MRDRSSLALGGSVLASIGASLCCVLPLVLVMAGLGGSWLGALQVFAPYRPFFVIAGVGALALAYWQIFRAEAACAPGEVCAEPRVQRRRKTLFWTVTTFVTALLLSPYLIPNLL